MTATETSPKEQELLDSFIYARRTRFALDITKYVAGADTFLILLLVIAWLLFGRYTQLLVIAGVTVPLAAVAWLYPRFHHRGWGQVSLYAFFALLLFSLIVPILLLPEVTLVATIGYVLVTILGNLILGGKESRWLMVFCILAFTADITLSELGLFDGWFPSLGETPGRVINIAFSTSALVITAGIIHFILLEQEKLFRQSKLANLEVEARATAEQEQREHLQTTVQEYVAYMTDVEQGNLVARLTFDGDGHRSDDPLLVLGHQLNQTIDSLQGMIAGIREAANNLGSAAAEILAAATQQVSGSDEQSAAKLSTCDH